MAQVPYVIRRAHNAATRKYNDRRASESPLPRRTVAPPDLSGVGSFGPGTQRPWEDLALSLPVLTHEQAVEATQQNDAAEAAVRLRQQRAQAALSPTGFPMAVTPGRVAQDLTGEYGPLTLPLEYTGLPGVRRSARAFTRGDIGEGFAEGGMAALGLMGDAALIPRGVKAPPIRGAPPPRIELVPTRAPEAQSVVPEPRALPRINPEAPFEREVYRGENTSTKPPNGEEWFSDSPEVANYHAGRRGEGASMRRELLDTSGFHHVDDLSWRNKYNDFIGDGSEGNAIDWARSRGYRGVALHGEEDVPGLGPATNYLRFPEAPSRPPIEAPDAGGVGGERVSNAPDGSVRAPESTPNGGDAGAGRYEFTQRRGGGRVQRADGRGGIDYVDNGDGVWGIRESGLDEELRGQGNGVSLYEELIRRAQAAGARVLQSDGVVSKDAQHVWSALHRRGYPVQFDGGHTYSLPLTERLPQASPARGDAGSRPAPDNGILADGDHLPGPAQDPWRAELPRIRAPRVDTPWTAELPDKPLSARSAPPRIREHVPMLGDDWGMFRPPDGMRHLSGVSRLPWDKPGGPPRIAARAAYTGTESGVDPRLILWGGVGASGPVGYGTALALQASRDPAREMEDAREEAILGAYRSDLGGIAAEVHRMHQRRPEEGFRPRGGGGKPVEPYELPKRRTTRDDKDKHKGRHKRAASFVGAN